jgi:hypothetical protein
LLHNIRRVVFVLVIIISYHIIQHNLFNIILSRLNSELRIWLSEPVLEIVLDNLTSIIRKELGLFLGFDQDLKRLASLLTTIKATLEDAEEKQFTNRAIEDWLLKLKDAAHVLDDILDECATEAMEMKYKGFKCELSHKVQSFVLSFFLPKHVVFRYKLAKKMKMIRERLDEIAAERSKFHLTEIVRERRGEVLD